MNSRTRGQAVIYIGVFVLVFLSFAALTVDGARLYFSARETQVAADAAAIGGMLRLIETGNVSDAVAGAQQSAALNTVNGQPATIDDTSNIVVGHWRCSPAGNCTPTFTANAEPYNAVRTTPSYPISNVLGIWQSVSHPRRNATAAWLTLGTGIPGIPVVLANCFSCYSSTCPPQAQVVTFASGGTGNTNAAWYYPGYPCGGSCGTPDLAAYVPAVSGCNTAGSPGISQPAGGAVAAALNAGSSGSVVHATHGTITSVCKDFQCLIGKQYLVGIMGTACGVPINGSQTITGFSTVKIVGTKCSGNVSGTDPGSQCTAAGAPFQCCAGPGTGCNNAVYVLGQFIDCAKPENAPICSSQLTSECPGCGTGEVVMVE